MKQQTTTPFIFGNNNSTSLSNIDNNIDKKDGSPFLRKNNVTDDDIRRVIHLPCLTSNIAGWYGDSIKDMSIDTFQIGTSSIKRKTKKKGKQQRKKQPNNSQLTNTNTSNQEPISNLAESKEEETVPVALPCTQRTSLLLIASSQYCSSPQEFQALIYSK